MNSQCNDCGRFVKVNKYFTDGDGEIVQIHAWCSKCGFITEDDFEWDYEYIAGENNYIPF